MREDVLRNTYLVAIREITDNADEVIEIVKEGVQMSMEPENTACLAEIEEEIIALQEAALALYKAKQRMEVSAADYAAKVKEYSEYSEKMRALEAKRNELQQTGIQFVEVRAWLDSFTAETMKEDTLTSIDAATLKMLVERILVRDEGIEVIFKCGVSIEKEYIR